MSSLNVAALSSVDIQKIKKEELTDIRSIKLDPSVPQDLRAVYVLKEMGNPYCFRVGDLGVKLEFWTAPHLCRMPFPISFSAKRAAYNFPPYLLDTLSRGGGILDGASEQSYNIGVM